jgi:coenzyme F420-reducing hydrogenase alpha subunit
MTRRSIKVDALARVEGEGALDVRITDGVLSDLKFVIYEPPRFFEALLRGRMFSDAPDITARICGICPIAYMLGASQAMEDALGIRVEGPLAALRRLIYCGEWIESHVLHIAMLHAPDFLGYQDSIAMAREHPEIVETALRLKKYGNRLLEAVGGRAVHPVNLKVGGFHSVPPKARFRALREEALWAVEAARGLIAFTAGLPIPDLERDYTFVALRHPAAYAITEGRLASSEGLDLPLSAFREHFVEDHVAHSNALHGRLRDGRPYHVGPLARYALNFDRLRPEAQAAAREAGLGPVVRNPYRSIIVRAVETLHACLEAAALLDAYEEPDSPAVAVTPRAGTGFGCTEAPRGLCWHSYTLKDDGTIETAIIVPPTAQNQPTIEDDLRAVVSANLDMADEDLKWRCEQTIRNYDPCISCATHFLTLHVVRD